MRAIVVTRYGGPEVLRLDEVPEPQAGPGEVLIRQAYAGVNFADIYQRTGLYHGQHTYGTQPPFRLGFEGVGEVVGFGPGLGPGASRFALGQKVGYCLGRGGYAELVAVEEAKVVSLPAGCDLKEAAALMLQGATAHYLTTSLFPLQPGMTALVHAAAGGVGRLLLQLAKARGARVVASVGSREKAAAVAALGADETVLYREEDLVARARAATGGEGVDVVYDSVGKATWEKSLAALKLRGTLVLFGASSGPVESVTPMALAEAGSVFFTRPHLAHYRRNAEEAELRASEVFALHGQGRLQVAVDRCFPLEEAAAAQQRLESGRSSGKILLEI